MLGGNCSRGILALPSDRNSLVLVVSPYLLTYLVYREGESDAHAVCS